MIKNLLTSLALTMSFAAVSQTNLGFETWASGNPTGWTTYNAGATGSVSQITTGAPEGASAAKLQTTSCPFCPFAGLPSKLPGFVYQKVAYTQDPISFDVYVDYNIAANDTGGILIFTSSGGTANIISLAGERFTGATTGWTAMNYPFTTIGFGVIDTLEIAAASSDSLVLGTTSIQNTASILRVDGIVLNLATGEKDAIGFTEYFAYPNPTSGDFNIVAKNSSAVKVEIFDVNGKLVGTQTFTDKKVKVSTANFAAGLYIYKIMDENNATLKTSKFNVTK
jgi:hypothetical protein